jgi:hypothetical protein
MANKNRIKRQTMVHKILHSINEIEQQESHYILGVNYDMYKVYISVF